MIKKVVALWLSLAMILSFFAIVDIISDTISISTGGILYVNETGSDGAYKSIQAAINACSDGETVYVYNGTYYENVIVNKSISLIGETRDATIINGSSIGDVIHIISDLVNITGFTVVESGSDSGDAGLELNNVRKCKIMNNNISSNNGNGIYLSLSSHNNITGNNVINNNYGIVIDSSNNNNITSNNVSFNNYHGLFLFKCSNNSIASNKVSNNDEDGIHLELSSYNEIIVNNIYPNNYNGIILGSSPNNTITSNNASNNFNGISLKLSSSNYILDNYVTINEWLGIDITSSSNNNIISNIVLSNFYCGISLDTSANNNITDNFVSSNINYGIWLDESSNNNINDNNISSNIFSGLYLWESSNNSITRNNVSNNMGGICLSLSLNNNITCNRISPTNQDGISLIGSSNNMIYHNNIINNINQAYDDMNDNFWNDSYPSSGNYWSDYVGVDNFKGPTQNIPGSDGIGDTPYTIDSDSQDNYPLMEPYKPLENFTVLKQGWNLISIPLIQEEQNLTRVLGAIDGWYDAVQWYDATDTNNPWKHQKVGKPFGNDLFELNETMGFWVHITQPGETIFIYNGTQPTSNQTISLSTGWNMVGYPSLTSYNRTEKLNNLTFGDHIDAIWTYNSTSQRWVEIGETDYFQIGRGYYIHAKTKCEWEVPL